MRALRYVAVIAIGCASEPTKITPGQLLLYVDTDAPIPAGPGQSHSFSTPLFDRLRIEIFEPGATAPCPTCTNEFEVDAAMFGDKRVSVGIAPKLGQSGYRARVRLFQTAFVTKSGEPNLDATIETTVLLPPVNGDTVVSAAVTLLTDRLAQPTGSLEVPAPAEPPLAKSLVGTWSGAARIDCKDAPPAGAVCVPGGAYWMGNPNAPGFNPTNYVLAPRLVVLSPFFMSSKEMLVRDFRAAGKTPKRSWSGSSQGITTTDWCTFTAAEGPFDAYPMNCLTLTDAQEYCRAVGGDLPTEAQFEYVDGGLASNTFPWGRDEPACDEASFGRGGWGILGAVDSPCKPETGPGGPLLPGKSERDRLDLPGGTLFDLAGNMSEWTRDTWNRIDEPCWDRAKVHHDPLCTTASPADGELAVRRGGDWAEVSTYMVSSARFSADPTFANINTGFRCVWPATAK